MPDHSKTETITRMCDLIAAGRVDDARDVVTRDYPFAARLPAGRNYSEATSTRVFMRDGFIDRYSGDRLISPGVLRLLSLLLPDAFPFHPNWKMSKTQPAYWELFPTIDHVVPVARGGADDEPNWVTTSMLRNSAKGLWTFDELGWQLRSPGDVNEWDGLTGWFVRFGQADSRLLADRYVKCWHRAAITATAR